MINKYLNIIVFILIIGGCSNTPRDIEDNKPKTGKEDDHLVNINKYLVGKDADIINGYIKRRNWDLQVSQTGLWYRIYFKGDGPKSSIGKKATINYKVELLETGKICYSSDKSGPKTFTIGRGGVEKGLEEGILLMGLGDKATFILPPHLAHGLVGDENCIPARAIIIYDVELIKLSD